MSDAFWIILTGSLVAISSGLLGCFLILRKMAMVGDAISHAVLPGIVIAYWFTGELNSLPMLIGAAGVGLLATFIIQTFHDTGRMQNDASIGITFTWLFAVGIIMISAFTGNIDLDLDCVLYGEIAFVPISTWSAVAWYEHVPTQVWILLFMLFTNLAFIIIGYKGLTLTTFDPKFAAAIGVSTAFWHYSLMGAVSLTTVTAFESVGAILVVAFLVGPAATAYLFTDDLKKMLALSALFGLLASVSGYYVAVWLNSSIASAMAVMVGVLFTLAFIFSPKYGLISKRLGQKFEEQL